jgi:2'-5' RNA ligase
MRAFIALNVPEHVRRRAEEIENDFRIDGLTLVKKEEMHLTLQFLGEIDAAQAENAVDAINSVKRQPFAVSLSGVSYFTPRLIRVIYIGTDKGTKELRELYAKLGSTLTSRGVGFDKEKNYTPHLTIARVKRVNEMRRLREALEKNANADAGSFIASSISLKESSLTPYGHVYRNLHELKL